MRAGMIKVGLGVRVVGIFMLVWVGCLCAPVSGFALPEGRHYEMVSPPYKGGYGIFSLISTGIEAVAPNGGSVAFGSIGRFVGAPANRVFTSYLARRGETTGWSTVPLVPPATTWPYNEVLDFSSTLGSSVTIARQGTNVHRAEIESNETEFLLHELDTPDTAENFEVAGETILSTSEMGYEGASIDLSHIIFKPLPTVPLVPEADGVSEALFSPPYDMVSRGGGEHPLHFIGLNNGKPTSGPIDTECKVDVGTESGKKNKISALTLNGSEIVFSTCAGSPSSEQVFVRLNDERTLEVSRTLEAGPFGGCFGGSKAGEVPCQGATTRPSAEFAGASEDGSRVFFRTSAPLSPEDKDTGSDLYMATIGCLAVEPDCVVSRREVTSLVQVSHDANAGEAADVQGVVAVSPDGSHVYFVAHGVLGGGSNVEGHAPVGGADNLYVFEPAPDPGVEGPYRTVFVADLCSGPGFSGMVVDARCPADLEEGELFSDRPLWASSSPQAQTTATGGFLVFSSYGQLVSDDTDNAKDVYRYDAETGLLERVSVGEDGSSKNGNCEDGVGVKRTTCDATIASERLSAPYARARAGLESRAISEDGSRIVFRTAEPLSSDAVNGLMNAYEWHSEPGSNEASVSLVSSGSDEQPVEVAVITPSGQDIFFVTVQGLLPQDTDGATDVYDARLGSGLPVAPTALQSCASDACQGPLTNPAPLLVPGSVSQAPGENLAPPPKVVKPKKKPVKKTKKKTKKPKRAHRSARKAARLGGRR